MLVLAVHAALEEGLAVPDDRRLCRVRRRGGPSDPAGYGRREDVLGLPPWPVG